VSVSIVGIAADWGYDLAQGTPRRRYGLYVRSMNLFTRTVGWLVTPIWLLAMGWLVNHDIVPHWTASPPPALRPTDWLRDRGARSQFTIYDEFGEMGSVWTDYLVDERSIRRDDLVWIDRLPMDLAPVRIGVESVFTGEGVLDEFTIRLETTGAGRAGAKLHGERFHSDFSFTFESGPIERAFKIPLVDGGLVSGAFHPFGMLTNLRVGQRWRMQVVNPIAMLTGVGDQFIPLLVEVTGEQRIPTAFGGVNCLVVESPNAKAWVDAAGVVQVQEMTLPVIGTMRIEREADFDEAAYESARNYQSPKPRRERQP